MPEYSNPRMQATFSDWPLGRQTRGECEFTVEQHPKRGERCARRTRSPGGAWRKPKTTTYARRCRIVDGDDGRTYLVEQTAYGFFSVMDSALRFEVETVHEESSPERHATLAALFVDEAPSLF